MKLKRFDNKLPEKKKSIKQIIAVLCICLIAVTSFTSYAIFKVQHEKQFVKSKVGAFSKLSLTVIVDGIEKDELPGQEEGKIFEKIECTKGNAEWNESTWELTNINASGRTECTVSFITKVELESPVLDNGLVPVVYQASETEGEEGKWIKADTSEEWYNYDKQMWANAVTVSSETRDDYTSASAGTEISMDDIETMWVWIPRYEYNSWLLSEENHAYYGGTAENPGTQVQPKGIEINFISKETITPSSDNFTIHDAFWWDDNNNGVKDANEQLGGIWVAKFEMSAANLTNTLQNPIIKPNVKSWRNAQIGTMWTAIHNNMNGENNVYGLINSDAHLMKNMEWGAVAYLSQSIYGKYGNPNYEGADKEIAQNNCSTYKTGIGGDIVTNASSYSTCNTNTYETEKGQAASTTGNIYGIYDMSGGAFEYVMGIQAVENSNPLEPMVGYAPDVDSGWSGKVYDIASEKWIDYTGKYDRLGDDPETKDKVEGIGSKYYDLYDYNEKGYIGLTRYHKGDATYETAGWYSDETSFVYYCYPFFTRGGSDSSQKYSGVFNMYSDYGGAHATHSGRPALVQTN